MAILLVLIFVNNIVTLTATGTKSGLSQPVTAQNSFVLQIGSIAPIKTGKDLPAANMGENYDEDLNVGYFTTPGVPDDTYTFVLTSQSP